jgi:hypothetical protein
VWGAISLAWRTTLFGRSRDGQASLHLLSAPLKRGLTSSPIKWFCAEYLDVHETQAAFRDLHDRLHVLATHFALYTTKLLSTVHRSSSSAPPSLTQTISLSLRSHIPFPSAEAPISEEQPPSRSARPRSASAEAGDRIKAFSLASTRFAEDLHRRIDTPVLGTQSFDASMRLVDVIAPDRSFLHRGNCLHSACRVNDRWKMHRICTRR